MDDKLAFVQLSAVLTGLYNELLYDKDDQELNAPIAEKYARLLRGEFPEKFPALLNAYKALNPPDRPPNDDVLLDKLRATQAFKDNEFVAKQIVNVWYFSQFNDEKNTLIDGGFYERGAVWPLIKAHPIGFSKQMHGYWTREPDPHPKLNRPKERNQP